MIRFAFLRTLVLACGLLPALPSFAAATPAAEAPRFDVWEYQVEGATQIDEQTIGRTVYPFLGPDRNIEHVEAARSALEAAFRDAGYGTVVVNIPEQDVENGIVRLEVTEGRVERLRITGSRYFALGRIRESLPALATGRVPQLPKVQEQLAKLNRATPDRAVTPVLKPGRRTGDVEIELKVEDRLPLHGSVELNDEYTRSTTRTRLINSLRYDNLWQREHSFGLSYQMTPEDPSEVKVLSGTYLMRPQWLDGLVALYAVKSDSDVLTVSGGGGGVGVLGKGVITGARFIKPLPAIGSLYHNVTAGLDYKDFETTIAPQDGAGFITPISYLKFVAAYGGFRSLERVLFNYNLETNFGVRGLGNTEKEFENQRFQGKPNFVFLRANARLEAPLVRTSTIRVEASGQVASGAIISNEQFTLGGVDGVRGYIETQALVDDAIQGGVELVSPPLQRLVPVDWLSAVHVIAFSEGAQGRIIDPLPGQPESYSLGSVGIGLELETALGIGTDIAWAYPLVDDSDIESGESRLHFRFAYEF